MPVGGPHPAQSRLAVVEMPLFIQYMFIKHPERERRARCRLETREETGQEYCFWGWNWSSGAQVQPHPLPVSAVTLRPPAGCRAHREWGPLGPVVAPL